MEEWNFNRKKHHFHVDTEPAFIAMPGHECCDKPIQDCVCVTEEDVENWNKISSLSGISDSALSGLSALESITESANGWNNTLHTVQVHSGDWNQSSSISSISEISSISSKWNNTYKTVSSNSSNWNSAYYNIHNVLSNTSAISALSAQFELLGKLHFSPDVFSGDGSENTPYNIKNYVENVELLNELCNEMKNFYNENYEPIWMSTTASGKENGTNPYLNSLFSALNETDNYHNKTLNKHGELIEWLLKNMSHKENMIRFSAVDNITQDNIGTMTAENTIFYSI